MESGSIKQVFKGGGAEFFNFSKLKNGLYNCIFLIELKKKYIDRLIWYPNELIMIFRSFFYPGHKKTRLGQFLGHY